MSPRARPCSLSNQRKSDHRGNDHAPAPDVQPQCNAGGRHPAAHLLLAGSQGRNPSAKRCWKRLPMAIPRFFLGTDSAPACPRHQGKLPAVVPAYSSAHAGIELYAQAFAAGRTTGEPARLCQRAWRGFLRTAAQRQHEITLARKAVDRARLPMGVRRGELVPCRPARQIAMALLQDTAARRLTPTTKRTAASQ